MTRSCPKCMMAYWPYPAKSSRSTQIELRCNKKGLDNSIQLTAVAGHRTFFDNRSQIRYVMEILSDKSEWIDVIALNIVFFISFIELKNDTTQ